MTDGINPNAPRLEGFNAPEGPPVDAANQSAVDQTQSTMASSRTGQIFGPEDMELPRLLGPGNGGPPPDSNTLAEASKWMTSRHTYALYTALVLVMGQLGAKIRELNMELTIKMMDGEFESAKTMSALKIEAAKYRRTEAMMQAIGHFTSAAGSLVGATGSLVGFGVSRNAGKSDVKKAEQDMNSASDFYGSKTLGKEPEVSTAQQNRVNNHLERNEKGEPANDFTKFYDNGGFDPSHVQKSEIASIDGKYYRKDETGKVPLNPDGTPKGPELKRWEAYEDNGKDIRPDALQDGTGEAALKKVMDHNTYSELRNAQATHKGAVENQARARAEYLNMYTNLSQLFGQSVGAVGQGVGSLGTALTVVDAAKAEAMAEEERVLLQRFGTMISEFLREQNDLSSYTDGYYQLMQQIAADTTRNQNIMRG